MAALFSGCSAAIDERLEEFLVQHDPQYIPAAPRPLARPAGSAVAGAHGPLSSDLGAAGKDGRGAAAAAAAGTRIAAREGKSQETGACKTPVSPRLSKPLHSLRAALPAGGAAAPGTRRDSAQAAALTAAADQDARGGGDGGRRDGRPAALPRGGGVAAAAGAEEGLFSYATAVGRRGKQRQRSCSSSKSRFSGGSAEAAAGGEERHLPFSWTEEDLQGAALNGCSTGHATSLEEEDWEHPAATFQPRQQQQQLQEEEGTKSSCTRFRRLSGAPHARGEGRGRFGSDCTNRTNNRGSSSRNRSTSMKRREGSSLLALPVVEEEEEEDDDDEAAEDFYYTPAGRRAAAAVLAPPAGGNRAAAARRSSSGRRVAAATEVPVETARLTAGRGAAFAATAAAAATGDKATIDTHKLGRAFSVAVTGLKEQVKHGGELLWRSAVSAAEQVQQQASACSNGSSSGRPSYVIGGGPPCISSGHGKMLWSGDTISQQGGAGPPFCGAGGPAAIAGPAGMLLPPPSVVLAASSSFVSAVASSASCWNLPPHQQLSAGNSSSASHAAAAAGALGRLWNPAANPAASVAGGTAIGAAAGAEQLHPDASVAQQARGAGGIQQQQHIPNFFESDMHAWRCAAAAGHPLPAAAPYVWGDGTFDLLLQEQRRRRETTGKLIAIARAPPPPPSEDGAANSAGGSILLECTYTWRRRLPSGALVDVPGVQGNVYRLSADDIGCRVEVSCTPLHGAAAAAGGLLGAAGTAARKEETGGRAAPLGQLHASIGPFHVDAVSRCCIANSFAASGARFPCTLVWETSESTDDESSLSDDEFARFDRGGAAPRRRRRIRCCGSSSRREEGGGGGGGATADAGVAGVASRRRGAAAAGGARVAAHAADGGPGAAAAGFGGSSLHEDIGSSADEETRKEVFLYISEEAAGVTRRTGERERGEEEAAWHAKFSANFPAVLLHPRSSRRFTLVLNENTCISLDAYTRHQRDVLAMTMRCFHARALVGAAVLLEKVHAAAAGEPFCREEFLTELEDRRVDLYVILHSLHTELQQASAARWRAVRDGERMHREKLALEEEMTSTIDAFQKQLSLRDALSGEEEGGKEEAAEDASWQQLQQQLQAACAQNRTWRREVEELQLRHREMKMHMQQEAEKIEERFRERLETLAADNLHLQQTNARLMEQLSQQHQQREKSGSEVLSSSSTTASLPGEQAAEDSSNSGSSCVQQQQQEEIERLRRELDAVHLEKLRERSELTQRCSTLQEKLCAATATQAQLTAAMNELEQQTTSHLTRAQDAENKEAAAAAEQQLLQAALAGANEEITLLTAERNRQKSLLDSLMKDWEKSKVALETATAKHQKLLQEKQQGEQALREQLQRQQRQLKQQEEQFQQEQQQLQQQKQQCEAALQQQRQVLQERAQQQEEQLQLLEKEVQQLKAAQAKDAVRKHTAETGGNGTGGSNNIANGGAEEQLRLHVESITSKLAAREEENKKLRDERDNLKMRLRKLGSKAAPSGET